MKTGMGGAEDLFDREEEYDAMLDRGLRLTGEAKDYFVQGRLGLLRDVLPKGFSPRRILDFGCGTGGTTAALAAEFTDARVTGVDTAMRAIAHAQKGHGGGRVEFYTVGDLVAEAEYDLCYVNGVLHHIPPDRRPDALSYIHAALVPGGLFSMFENNPWNPGTRLVMSRIPFDRDAQTLSPPAAGRLLRRNGFVQEGSGRHLFFFPASLRALRGLEPYMRWLPFGGQYLILARRTGASPGLTEQ